MVCSFSTLSTDYANSTLMVSHHLYAYLPKQQANYIYII